MLQCLALIVTLGPKPDPMVLLRQNQEAIYALKSYRAICFIDYRDESPKSKHEFSIDVMTAEKPLQFRDDNWRVPRFPTGSKSLAPKGATEITIACDGRNLYTQMNGHYFKIAPPTAEDVGELVEAGHGFFSRETSTLGLLTAKVAGRKVNASYDGTEIVEGVVCDKVKVDEIFHGHVIAERHEIYYLANRDHLLRKMITHESFTSLPASTSILTVHKFEIHPKIDPRIFKYVAPKGITETVIPK